MKDNTNYSKLGKIIKANGGDITPDGHWMAIKNEEYILLWERQGAESLTELCKRAGAGKAAVSRLLEKYTIYGFFIWRSQRN